MPNVRTVAFPAPFRAEETGGLAKADFEGNVFGGDTLAEAFRRVPDERGVRPRTVGTRGGRTL